MKHTLQLRTFLHYGLLLGALCAAFGNTPPARATQSGCATPSFTAAPPFNNISFPRTLAAADFNLDGRLDLVVFGQQITLLLSDGNGGFSTRGLPLNPAVGKLAVGDFNGDRRPDLLVGNRQGLPQLLLGNGFGGFPTALPLAFAPDSSAVAVGDFNADGKLDVALGRETETDATPLAVALGDGAGGFGAPLRLAAGSFVQELVVGDFNVDGKPDIAALGPGDEGVDILLNRFGNGGGFAAPVAYNTGLDAAQAMAAGDFNSDGALDLVVVNRVTARISVQLNSGAGSFIQSQNFGARALGVVTGDFNSDGKVDLVLGGVAPDLEIRLGNDAGQFGNALPFPLGGRGQFLLPADLNADGRSDLAVLISPLTESANITIFYNTCGAPPLNTPPVITVSGALTRQQGAPAATDTLASVNDGQTPKGKLNVFAINLPPGLSVANLVNQDGVISGSVSADCTAAPGALTATLLVTDEGGLAATAEFRVNVTPNTPPALGAYPNTTIGLGAGATVLPNSPPSDNVRVTEITATVSAGFTRTLSVNQTNGAVTITNAGPVGTHTVTVTARDNCNAALTQSFTVTVVQPACVNTRPGLVSWYRGENNAADHQNANNGAGVGGLAFAAGRVGDAFSFNGASELVIPHAPALNFQQFTFEGWVYPTLLDGAVEFILNKEDNPFTTYHYEWGIAGAGGTIPVGTLVFALNGLNGLPNEFGGFINGGATVPLNAWTHVALSFDGATIKSYVNGAVARMLTGLSGNLITSTGPLKIGSRSDTLIAQLPANRFNGLIDELSLYNRALSDAELRAIYQSGTAGKCTSFVNTAPAITAGAALTQARGNSGALAVLATVSDTETAASELTVTVANAPEGLSFGKLTNTNGTITATVNVACDVALGANAVTLRVSDGALSSTTTFTVNVTANPPPVLGAYTAPGALPAGGSVTVTPSAAPSDNGQVASVVATVPGAFTGSVSVIPATGVVTLSNARPPGAYSVLVTATDNCGAATTASFNFTVSKLASNVTLTASGAPYAQGQPADLLATVAAATPNATPPSGTVTFFDGNTTLGTAALDGTGTARLRTTALEPGARALTASYGGDALYLAATSAPLGLTVAFALTNVSAASYRAAALAPEQIVAAFGARLATTNAAATTLPLPTTLGGTIVRVRDSAGTEQLAPLFFVSATQVNYLLPRGLAEGLATITVIAGNGVNSLTRVTLAATNPGLFTADASGRGLPAAQVLRVLPNGTQRFEAVARFDTATNRFVAVPIDLGAANEQVFLVLFGTGWRGRNPALPAAASLGSAIAEVAFLGAAPGLIGVDQANLRLPRSLLGAGEVEVNLNVDGKAVNPVRVQFK